MTQNSGLSDAILRLPDVRRRVGLSRSSIYLQVAEGTFPRPISLGPRAVGWLASEIQSWLQMRVEISRKRG
jgi:prophage regulatory protein